MENLMNTEKITRNIPCHIKDLQIKMNVKRTNDKKGKKEFFHSVFAYEGNTYFKINYFYYLSLELSINGEGWSKDKVVMLDDRGFYKLVKAMKKTIDDIYTKHIFAVKKSGEILMYSDVQKECVQKLFNLPFNQKIVIQPAVIYDENEVSYEGVIMFLNNSKNYIEMSINEFEDLYEIFKRIDLFMYSQMIVNYFISNVEVNSKKDINEETRSKNSYSKKNIFDTKKDAPVTSTLVEKSNLFEGLKGV